jgi:uncharacterized protein (TIGR04255 family)
MSKHRQNAPLVEVIAELKWDVPGFPSPGSGMPAFISPEASEDFEKFFENFGDLINAEHSHKEKLTPPGFPALTHQPIYRFANRQDGHHTSLCQIGPGIISIHAVPPYESWNSFREIVRRCIDALLRAKRTEPQIIIESIASIDLRYVDAFGKKLTQGHSAGSFISEVMGFKFLMPEVIMAYLAAGKDIVPYSQTRVPMDNGFSMLVSIGEGTVHGDSAIISDTVITKSEKVQNDIENIMNDFDFAHEIIKNVFNGVTEKISHLMPESEV